jgi:hypothetical protein
MVDGNAAMPDAAKDKVASVTKLVDTHYPEAEMHGIEPATHNFLRALTL